MTAGGTEALETAPLRIDVEAADELNYAMVHNAVPLIQRIAVSNPTAEAIHKLEVSASLQPSISEVWTARIDVLPAGATYHFDEVDLPLDRDRLVNAAERERARLAVEVRSNDSVRGAHATDVDLLAYNEWSAVSVPQLIAAFVLPNHPVVAETLTLARKLLESSTGDPAFNGYQSGSAQRVSSQVAALWPPATTHV